MTALVGNGKRVSVERNADVLRVVGNRCEVSVGLNVGVVLVAGNACRVSVGHNDASIVVTGNDCHVVVATQGASGSVTYTGNGGSVKAPSTGVVNSSASAAKPKTNAKTSVRMGQAQYLQLALGAANFVRVVTVKTC